MKVKLPTFQCQRCGHKWHPKKESKPRCCGFCKSPYWDTPVERESACKSKHVQMCGSCKPCQA